MQQVFDNRPVSTIHAFAMGTAVVSFSRVPSALVLITGTEYTFGRQRAVIPILNSSHAVVVAGLPQGEMRLHTVITTISNMARIIAAYNTACGGGYITIVSRDPCTGAIGRIIFGDCVLTEVGGGVSGQSGFFAGRLTFGFSQMWVENV